MHNSTIQFVTRTKLSELSRQRESLRAKYREIEDRCNNERGIDSLQALYDGLKSVLVGHRPLHRELPNLQALLRSESAPDSLVAFWFDKLMSQLERGRIRADVVYLFGASLGEWDDQDGVNSAWIEDRRRRHVELLKLATTTPAQRSKLDLLGKQLDRLAGFASQVSERVAEAVKQSVNAELAGYPRLSDIAANEHHLSEVRAEAKRFDSDGVLSRQFNEALQVATRDPRDWSWPDAVRTRPLWTRNKWRLYPMLSLVDLAVLQSHSDFWSEAIGGCYTNATQKLVRLARLQKLEELGSPEVILSNERRMLALEDNRAWIDWYEPFDPWTQQPIYQEGDKVDGIVRIRVCKQGELRDPHQLGYGYGEGSNAMVRQVHAEVRLLRAAFPDQPLHVLKLDIQDFFASVPHDTLLELIGGLGAKGSGLEFVERFLSVPLEVDGAATASRRGVPMEQPFSHWLCEWLLRFLEEYVHANARVRIVRQLDDICVLAPTSDDALAGWNAVREFVSDCGLTINEEKCGAVTIGGDALPGLPSDGPRWGMVELNCDGEWQVHEPTYNNLLADARREVDARHAILAKVASYNEHLKFLTSSLGLAMDLGDRHRRSVNAALARFENQFFDGRSVFDGLRDEISTRYENQFQSLPLSWMVWPITAGGLGLRSTTVLCGQYQIAYEDRATTRKSPPETRSDDWQSGDEDWAGYYEDLLETLEPAGCAESKVMNTLVESFIRRGKEISGGEQQGLTEYWRWILSIYGPEIIDRLGTFEFLLTELVPLQLIQEKLMQADTDEA